MATTMLLGAQRPSDTSEILCDACLLRLDHSGAVRSMRLYGGRGEDAFNGILATPDGCILCVGSTEAESLSTRCLVVKADP